MKPQQDRKKLPKPSAIVRARVNVDGQSVEGHFPVLDSEGRKVGACDIAMNGDVTCRLDEYANSLVSPRAVLAFGYSIDGITVPDAPRPDSIGGAPLPAKPSDVIADLDAALAANGRRAAFSVPPCEHWTVEESIRRARERQQLVMVYDEASARYACQICGTFADHKREPIRTFRTAGDIRERSLKPVLDHIVAAINREIENTPIQPTWRSKLRGFMRSHDGVLVWFAIGMASLVAGLWIASLLIKAVTP